MKENYKINLENLDRSSFQKPFTTANGNLVFNTENSLTVTNSGPTLIEDLTLIDKLSHFDRERISERVVHAKGAGAFGCFENYACQKALTCASFLQVPGEKTNCLVRFSTVIGSKGSADTARDPRGFAVKLYTKQGNLDIVGNHIPVFFINDAIKFPDVIHSLKPDPITNFRNPERFWDFISLTPEAMHMIMWLYSDNGTIKSYRKINGFGVNTYVWVNEQNQKHFIKYHWICQQPLETIDQAEATLLAGIDPDIASKDLYEAIECKNSPKWELCIQAIPSNMVNTLDFDILDDTKVWPTDRFPLIKIGMMTLNRNPQNNFNQVEQAAFCPANLVRGIELSSDRMLQGRSFSYHDTQRHRIGANFMQLEVNRPYYVYNNNQDGPMNLQFNPSSINYLPSNFENRINKPYLGSFVNGNIQRNPLIKQDNFTQAREKYLSYDPQQKANLISNLASELKHVNHLILDKILILFNQIDPTLCEAVKKAVNH